VTDTSEVEMVPLSQEYEKQMEIARTNYKKAIAKLEFAFDSYEEECIKEEMESFKKEVKGLRSKIDALKNEDENLLVSTV